jgi:hypothetical protein
VDNANFAGIAPVAGDFTFFGGLYRDVSLVATDSLSADMLDYGSTGVYLTQTSVSQASANLQIKTLVRNAAAATAAIAVKSVVVDAAGNIVTIGNQAGSYNKICFLEIVSADLVVNEPPTVGISSPSSGATFIAPATIAIAATATDRDGTISRVEFFDGATKLGEDTNGSDGWSLIWPNVALGPHTLTARATDNATAATTSSPVGITVAAPPVVTIRLDVGSAGSFTDSGGSVWQPDPFGSGGIISSKPNPIDGTLDDDLYRTYRYGTFSYAIPVANGTYDVSLKFIETWWSAPGQRIFSVSAEGTTTLANLDLFAIAGRFTTVDRTFSVVVTDGVLNLSFTSSVDNAIVSGMAIVPRP